MVAGWINLKVMLVYTPDSFLLKPGMVLTVLGLLLSLALARGPRMIGRIGFNLHWMLLGMTCTTLGTAASKLAYLRATCIGSGRGLPIACEMCLPMIAGCSSPAVAPAWTMLLGTLVYRYVNHGLRLDAISHPAILGLLLIILGFQTFCFTLLMEMAQRVAAKARE